MASFWNDPSFNAGLRGYALGSQNYDPYENPLSRIFRGLIGFQSSMEEDRHRRRLELERLEEAARRRKEEERQRELQDLQIRRSEEEYARRRDEEAQRKVTDAESIEGILGLFEGTDVPASRRLDLVKVLREAAGSSQFSPAVGIAGTLLDASTARVAAEEKKEERKERERLERAEKSRRLAWEQESHEMQRGRYEEWLASRNAPPKPKQRDPLSVLRTRDKMINDRLPEFGSTTPEDRARVAAEVDKELAAIGVSLPRGGGQQAAAGGGAPARQMIVASAATMAPVLGMTIAELMGRVETVLPNHDGDWDAAWREVISYLLADRGMLGE